jgi:hypothetical protein
MVAAARDIAQKEIDSSAYFKATINYIREMKNPEQKKDISLFIEDALKEEIKKDPPEPDDYADENHSFIVLNHTYEQRRVQSNKNLQESNDDLKEKLKSDPYIKIGYSVINVMIK